MGHVFLDALKGVNRQGAPIWLMRQAGRHLTSYRAIREKHSFLEMCHNPDLVTKITMLPLEAYDLDAAILFSDILVVAEAMGLGLRFEDKLGPMIERPITSVHDIYNLPLPDISKLGFVFESIKQLKSQLNVPLIGFCGAPFTIASYLIEGKTSRDLKQTKIWMFKNPESFHLLLKKIADWSVAYLLLQIEAGVDALQIFDSWANSLAHYQFREFSLAYLHDIITQLNQAQSKNHRFEKPSSVPVILFCRGSSVFAPQLAEICPSGIGLDWNCQMSEMRMRIPSSIALQGNLDPHLLYASVSKIEFEVDRLLDEMKDDPAFIINLGHGVLPDVNEDAVRAVVNCVKRKRLCLSTSSF